jgi:nucleoside permease NupC
VAYQKLAVLIAKKAISARSATIATYAICGFSNPGAAGIGLAVLSSICPQRKVDFAELTVRSFIGGTVACFLTACIAGMLINSNDV